MSLLSRLRGQQAFMGGAYARKITSAYPNNGAITVIDGQHKLTKAGIGAYTLAAPTAADEGSALWISSTTANAHVITATGLIDDGVVGGSKTTMTFAAFPGASILLMVTGLKYTVFAKNLVTVT